MNKANKVFVVGLERTGTSSIKVILERLGYNVAGWNPHLMRLSQLGEDDKMIEYFKKSKKNAAQDYPWPFHYKKLDNAFDNSKFILSTRKNPEIWYKSIVYWDIKNWHEDKRRDLILNNMYFGNSPTPINHSCKWQSIYCGHNDEVRKYFQGRDNFKEFCFEKGDTADDISDFLGFDRNMKTPHRKSQKYENFDKLYLKWLKTLKRNEIEVAKDLG